MGAVGPVLQERWLWWRRWGVVCGGKMADGKSFDEEVGKDNG